MVKNVIKVAIQSTYKSSEGHQTYSDLPSNYVKLFFKMTFPMLSDMFCAFVHSSSAFKDNFVSYYEDGKCEEKCSELMS